MALQSGSRPHMVFARGEVRIAVFNNGNATRLPTGFEADVEGEQQFHKNLKSDRGVRELKHFCFVRATSDHCIAPIKTSDASYTKANGRNQKPMGSYSRHILNQPL